MSQDEMEARVRFEVSRELKVKFEEVRVVAHAKKQNFVYHTDRAGRVLRCAPAMPKTPKPAPSPAKAGHYVPRGTFCAQIFDP